MTRRPPSFAKPAPSNPHFPTWMWSERQQLRWLRRDTKARRYRAVALAGGGKREVARRARQIVQRRALTATLFAA